MTWPDLPLPCQGSTHLFFSDKPADQDKAKRICSACPLRVQCLDKAIKRREPYGIWGGLGPRMREWVISEMRKGAEQYRSALLRVFADLDQAVGNSQRPFQDAAACVRCGDPIRPGARPIDRNGPASTCGIVSTYNRGCRCSRCEQAKKTYDAERQRR